VVASVIDDAERKGWVRALARTLHEERAANDTVIAFFAACGDYPALLMPSERDDLRVALASVVPTCGALGQLVRRGLQRELADIVGAPVPDTTSSDLCLPVVIRWADHHDVVEALITGALESFPVTAVELHGRATPLRDAVRRRRPAGQPGAIPDPFTASDLEGRIMIDRTSLRVAVRTLSINADKRIIAVSGPSGSGKSHSLFFITHVAEKSGAFGTVAIDLKDEAAAKFRPHLLARSVVRQMGRNAAIQNIPREEDGATPARWVKELVDFIVGEVRSSGRLWLVVLDGFADPNLDPLTRDTIRELVSRAARETLLRVVLLHASDDLLPAETAGRVAPETIKPFTEDDLRGFLRAWTLARGVQAPPAVLDGIVQDVWNAAPNGGSERNCRLATELGAYLAGLPT
jgi:hypothetical protein